MVMYRDFDGAMQDSEDTTCHSGLDQGELPYITCAGNAGHRGKHWGKADVVSGVVYVMTWTGGQAIAGDQVPARSRERRPATSAESLILTSLPDDATGAGTCTFPGCSFTFHPETVRDYGTSGVTGWQYAPDSTDDVLPHEHALAEELAERESGVITPGTAR